MLNHNEVAFLFKVQEKIELSERQLLRLQKSDKMIGRTTLYLDRLRDIKRCEDNVSRYKTDQKILFDRFGLKDGVYSITYHEMTYLATFKDCILESFEFIPPPGLVNLHNIPKLAEDFPPFL